MDVWLGWARGPVFWTGLIFMVLGLAREVGLTAWGLARARVRAGERKLPVRQVARATLRWLLPVGRLRNRWPYSVATVVLHMAVILVPLFLAGHIELWRKGLGLSWPALPNPLATGLTLALLVSIPAVVLHRALSRAARPLGRLDDYGLPLLIGVIFASGFLVMHPGWNPLSLEAVLLVHVLSADLLFFLVPLTKLSHMVLLPFTQLISEVAWHFAPDAGSRVAAALGKEGEPI